MIFQNRREAGRMVSYKLDPNAHAGAIVLPLSPQALPVAEEVCRWLDGQLWDFIQSGIDVSRHKVILVGDVIADGIEAVATASQLEDQGAKTLVLVSPIANSSVMEVLLDVFDETLWLDEWNPGKSPEDYFLESDDQGDAGSQKDENPAA